MLCNFHHVSFSVYLNVLTLLPSSLLATTVSHYISNTSTLTQEHLRVHNHLPYKKPCYLKGLSPYLYTPYVPSSPPPHYTKTQTSLLTSPPPPPSILRGFVHLGAGLSVGLSGLAAGFAIGIVGDAGVRGTAQQPRLFVGMILILIFAEVRDDCWRERNGSCSCREAALCVCGLEIILTDDDDDSGLITLTLPSTGIGSVWSHCGHLPLHQDFVSCEDDQGASPLLRPLTPSLEATTHTHTLNTNTHTQPYISQPASQ